MRSYNFKDMVLNVSFTLITYGSKEYSEMVELRYQILRKPLGLVFADEYLAQEKSGYLCVCKEEDKIIGACILTPVDNKIIQLRQMAVADNYQGKSIGKKLIDFAEQTAIDHGFNKIILHARKTAVPFYEKLGYLKIGEEFTEVGLLHNEMKKEI